MLLEMDKLLSKQKDVVSTSSRNFGSITDSLNLFNWPEDTSVSSESDTISSIIKKIAFHPSIKTRTKFKMKSKFSFNLISTETTKRIINDLEIKKLLLVKFHFTFLKNVILFWAQSQFA